MSKLQPGGLAMIISANVSENIGKIVELINFLGPSTSDVSGEIALAWYVKCESGLLTTEGNNIMRAGIFSRRLMPLSGQDTRHTFLRQKESVNG